MSFTNRSFRFLSTVIAVSLLFLLATPLGKATASAPALPSSSSSVSSLDSTDASLPRTLVLYDKGGDWGWLGGIYAQFVANLTSHFGAWTAAPVTEYSPGQLNQYDAVIYIGSTYDEAIPQSFLDDVLAGSIPTLWLGSNIWQLHNRAGNDDKPEYFSEQYGWQYAGYDYNPISHISYKGTLLDRNSTVAAGIMTVTVTDPSKVTVLATAQKDTGGDFPWAVTAGNLTYIGEIPFTYHSETDRYLAFADIMFNLLAPATPERHRALIRFEDVSPASDPQQLRTLTDVLYKKGIPFSVLLFPVWTDPKGNWSGTPKTLTLKDSPEVVKALKYMQKHGGTIVMHGYTHQLGEQNNPYSGVSGADYEFYTAYIDENDNVILTAPVKGDSEAWAEKRMQQSITAAKKAGLGRSQLWTFPHYAASVPDYYAAEKMFYARYDRTLLFAGTLAGKPDYSHSIDQYFPYEVLDVYGSHVIPENLGNVSNIAFNNNPVVKASELLDRARKNLVVRDGFASFFFHPFYSPKELLKLVNGIEDLGYTFTSPKAVLASFR